MMTPFAKAFRRLSRDSASPLVGWHGTKAGDFDSFDPNRIGQTDDGFYGRGFYFSPNKEDAESYGPAKQYRLHIKNPFPLPSSGHMSHDSLFDLRDRLAGLEGGPTHLKTNREVPQGYSLQSREIDNRYHNPNSPSSRPTWTVYSVEPKPELYGTEHEIYGPEEMSPLAAVVHFNDQQTASDVGRGGWASAFLRREIDRNNLHHLLKRNGYDGIVVHDPDSGNHLEYVAFDPSQIEKVK